MMKHSNKFDSIVNGTPAYATTYLEPPNGMFPPMAWVDSNSFAHPKYPPNPDYICGRFWHRFNRGFLYQAAEDLLWLLGRSILETSIEQYNEIISHLKKAHELGLEMDYVNKWNRYKDWPRYE